MSNPGITVARLFYAIEHNLIYKDTHKRVLSSMADYYEKAHFLTKKQVAYAEKILTEYPVPEDLSPYPFRFPSKESTEQAENRSTDRVVMCEDGKRGKVIFQFSNETLTKVKTLPGRRFLPKEKVWVFPLSLDAVCSLKEWGFKLDPKIRKWYESQVNPAKVTLDSIPGLRLPLRPFQKEGVEFIESRGGRALVGDEMGLGKTPQALAWLQLHPENRPAVIVCPASLKYNWLQEVNKFMTGATPQVIDGKADKVDFVGDIIIINYDILPDDTEEYFTGRNKKDRHGNVIIGKDGKPVKEKKRRAVPGTGWWSFIRDMKPNTVIFDEIHKIKSHTSLRSEASKKIAASAKHVIGLSGTPLLNRPKELFMPLSVINKAIFPSFMKFATQYCGAKKTRWGWDFNGCTNTSELHRILTSTVMIRRLKKDVLPELPDKIRTIVPLDITNRSEYDRAEADYIEYLKSFDSLAAARAAEAEHLVKIEGLKRLSVKGKIGACIRWIEGFLESGEKLVVFVNHTDVLKKIQKKFEKISVIVDGGVSAKNRQKAVNDFQEKESVRLFIGNLDAASVGLTLTAASHTCFIEFGWTPGLMTQAEDRVHRIGQEADSVNAWYLVGRDTIDVDIIHLIEKKAWNLDAILDGEEVEDGGLFGDLLERLAS